MARDEGMVTLTGADQDGTGVDQTGATGTDAGGLTITENSDAGVYEAALGGTTVAGVVYSRAGDRVALLATSVLPEYRGRGIAGLLLGGVLEKIRAEGGTATLGCPFTAEFVDAHPEYADVVDSSFPGTARHRGRAAHTPPGTGQA
ncbi:GNAT family N-acetyltransferase [Nocardiopsis protaetiae]|uniref:GNAT family N-acetyltransferase n=1 Tax=Nocardiopsis protaetiae TaxID=3382270 RepID=UPI00387AAF0A